MRDSAADVLAADPDGNTVFSVHMYGVYDTAAEITSYLDTFTSQGLPIIVGEFGHNHSDGNPDEDTIMSYTRSQGIGWFAWSWSGNGPADRVGQPGHHRAGRPRGDLGAGERVRQRLVLKPCALYRQVST
jgi:hypothetical protein